MSDLTVRVQRMSQRELAAVLAGLRCLQADLGIQAHFTDDPMTADEINDLCVQLNAHGNAGDPEISLEDAECILADLYETLFQADVSQDGIRVYSDDNEWDAQEAVEVLEHVEQTLPSPGTAERVECSVCGADAFKRIAHRHGEGWVCDNCWDERLRASE